MAAWTEKQIKFVLDLHKEGYSRSEIAQDFNEEFGTKRTGNSIKHCIDTYQDYNVVKEAHIDSIRSLHSARKSRSKVARENKVILDHLEIQDDIKQALDEMFKTVKFTKPKISKKPSRSKKKKDMTIEHMLTDLHYGKLSETFNFEVARERMSRLAKHTIEEINRYSKTYNIDRSILFLGGDIIEGATIHGTESRMASESGNSEQITQAIVSLYEDYIVPVSSYGHKIKVIAVPGNHDRDGKDKTYQKPGKEAFTWIIYKTLEQLCKAANIKNIEFVITESIYHIEDIYGSKVLYEHGDHVKGTSKTAIQTHMGKRGVQNDTLIDFIRLGHYHERIEFGRGRIIMNPSLAGQDSYAEINGYDTEAAQTINYYIKTEKRKNPFYHSFCCYLDDEK